MAQAAADDPSRFGTGPGRAQGQGPKRDAAPPWGLWGADDGGLVLVVVRAEQYVVIVLAAQMRQYEFELALVVAECAGYVDGQLGRQLGQLFDEFADGHGPGFLDWVRPRLHQP